MKSSRPRVGGWWRSCCRWTRRRGSATGLRGWKMMRWARLPHAFGGHRHRVPSARRATSGRRAHARAEQSRRSHEHKHGRIKSSPVARRLAAQHAVDCAQIDRNRSARTCAAERRAAGDRSTVCAGSGRSAPSGMQPLSSMRRALARSMTLSNATVPQFVVERAVDWTALCDARRSCLRNCRRARRDPRSTTFCFRALPARCCLSRR